MQGKDSSQIDRDEQVDLEMVNSLSSVRVASLSDLDGIVETLTLAFFDDPLWGPVFPDVTRRAQQAALFWRLLSASAGRYPWTFVTEHIESVAIWIPPGGVELTSEEEAAFEEFLVEIAGRKDADNIIAINELFAESHPVEPHYYLSLLATHNQHRGHGMGMALLRENLARIDELGACAYLESTNPANNERYKSVGFSVHGSFIVPSGHVVTTMWRPAKSYS